MLTRHISVATHHPHGNMGWSHKDCGSLLRYILWKECDAMSLEWTKSQIEGWAAVGLGMLFPTG